MKFVKFDSAKVVFWKFDVHNGGVKDCFIRNITVPETQGDFPHKIYRAFTYNTPGDDNVTADMSVVIFNGASNKPTKYIESKVVQKYWI